MIVVCRDVSLDCHVEGRVLDNSIKRVNASPSLNKDKENTFYLIGTEIYPRILQ